MVVIWCEVPETQRPLLTCLSPSLGGSDAGRHWRGQWVIDTCPLRTGLRSLPHLSLGFRPLSKPQTVTVLGLGCLRNHDLLVKSSEPSDPSPSSVLAFNQPPIPNPIFLLLVSWARATRPCLFVLPSCLGAPVHGPGPDCARRCTDISSAQIAHS